MTLVNTIVNIFGNFFVTMDYKDYILSELKRRKISVKDAFETLGVSKQTFYNKISSSTLDPVFLTLVKDKLGIDSNINADIVNTEGNIVSKIRRPIRKEKALIPFYNADFMAGKTEMFYDDGNMYPEYYMDVPEFYGSTAFRAYSDSMERLIKSGTILFGIKLENWRIHLEYGQIYGITCVDGRRYLKYIRRAENNKDEFLLKSENPNYDDFELPKTEIKNIWLIEGWLDKRT